MQTTNLLLAVDKLAAYLPYVQILNLGGGHNLDGSLQELLRQINQFYPHLQVIIEPGHYLVNECMELHTRIVDKISSQNREILLLDTTVGHHPEVFEYQFTPYVAHRNNKGSYSYLLAGSSCLGGDQFGECRFEQEKQIGETIVFPRMGAYSLARANWFNGLPLPSVYLKQGDQLELIKSWQSQDYPLA